MTTDYSAELKSDNFEAALMQLASAPPAEHKPTVTGDGDRDYLESDMYGAVQFGQFGLYMQRKRRKLDVQNDALRENDPEKRPQIFAGLAVYLNGATGDKGFLELRDLLVLHGGHYVPYLDKKSLVTHIVASNLTPSKRDEFKTYKVAKPEWLVESVLAGRLLDWRDFALLACDNETTARHGFDDVKARLGSSTGQRSLLSLGVGKSTLPPHPKVETKPQATTSSDTETMQDLSDRGNQIGTALNKRPRPAQDFFKRPVAAAPVPPVQSRQKRSKYRHLKTSDPDAPTEVAKHPYLPQAQLSERTEALLADPEWLSKHTAAADDFIETYFQQSRLHFLSTWKVELKNLVGELQGKEARQPRRKKLTGTIEDGRTVFHVDMDCFFVSAGLLSRPEMRGKPVAVCHARNSEGLASTSEIASCSYEARAKGVRNGMSLGRARELCPEIQTMPFEFDLYKSLASKFYDILLRHAVFLQAVSVDEALLEVEPKDDGADPAMELAQRIRDEIREATGCEASIGISHNILLARLATRKAKPANAYHLLPAEVESFLAPLAVDSLPGIGWNLQEKLENFGITTVGQLTQVPLAQLQETMGQTNGAKFQAFARGIDPRELQVSTTRQSVSAEVNYGIRLSTIEQVEKFVKRLAVEVAARAKEENLKARALNLKVMKRHPEAPIDTPKFLGHGWCDTKHASSGVRAPGGRATDDGVVLGETAWKLMQSLMIEPKELRGIGIQLSKLEKDGVPVDIVIDPGQTRLSFAKLKPHVEAAPLKPIPAPETIPTPAQPDPSIIVTEYRPLLRETTPDKKPAKPQRPRKQIKPKQDAPIFRHPMQDVTESEIKALGIDVGWWNEVDNATRKQAYDDHRKREKNWTGRTDHLLGASKPYLDAQGKREKCKQRERAAEVVDLTHSSSPIRLTDSDLAKLGIDPDYFHGLSPSFQWEEYTFKQKHFVRGTTVVSKKDQKKSGPKVPLVSLDVPTMPVFQKSRPDMDPHDALTQWVEDEARAGPAAPDIKKFRKYVGALVDASEFALAADLLRWFRLLIGEAFATGKCRKVKVQQEWRDAWQVTFEVANAKMRELRGCDLKVV